MLDELRKILARLERPPGLEAAGLQPLGISAIDAALGGGLTRGALHEIAAVGEAHIAAATGFALGVTHGGATPSPRLRGEGRGEGHSSSAQFHRKPPSPAYRRCAAVGDLSPQAGRGKHIVWVAETMALIENGAPCGSGLDELGLAPERLITVNVARLQDLLWTMEEALHCPAAAIVIGEIRHQALDAVALRRLSLAAATHGALALLLRATPPDDASTAATRWIIGAAASSVTHGQNYFFGPPRIEAQLVRNRRGPLGSWTLKWSEFDERFILASTHPQPVAAAAADRPARAIA